MVLTFGGRPVLASETLLLPVKGANVPAIDVGGTRIYLNFDFGIRGADWKLLAPDALALNFHSLDDALGQSLTFHDVPWGGETANIAVAIHAMGTPAQGDGHRIVNITVWQGGQA